MRLFSILFLCASSAFAGDPARDANWQQDLDYLAAQLTGRHPNLFFKTPKADFDRAVADLRSAIPDLSDSEVIVGMAAVAALPGDAHTSLSPLQRVYNVLPIRFYWFQDGLFVSAIGADYPRALGAKVVRIGDQTVDQAYQTVSRIISHENDFLLRAVSPSYLRDADVLQALRIAPSNASVHLVFEDLAGRQFEADLPTHPANVGVPGVFAPDPDNGYTPLAQQHTDQNYWFTYLPPSKTLYFAYDSCIEMASLPFAKFNEQLWSAFDANPVDRIVVDMRNNGGGSDILIQPFFDSAAQRQARLGGIAQYVIVGRITFSAAIDDSVLFKRAGWTFIGETTGGSVNHYGNVRQFNLPNSGLRANHSLEYRSFAGFTDGPLVPDVNIPLYAADTFARYDPFLAAALAGSKPNAATTASAALAVVNSASERPNVPVAAGSLATVFGSFSGVAPASFGSLPLPNVMNGVQVTLNGIIAPLLAVGPSQINFQVPAGMGPGAVTTVVQVNGAQAASGTVQVAASAPGIFIADPFGVARPGVVLDQNFNLVSDASPATPGSVIRIYATGTGTNDDVRVFLGTEPAEVLSAAPDGLIPGLRQITARIPQTNVSGQMPLFVVSGTSVSNGVTIRVAN